MNLLSEALILGIIQIKNTFIRDKIFPASYMAGILLVADMSALLSLPRPRQ